MKHNYKTAIDFIFKYEGGYVNHPNDPGGPTNRGITLKTARAFWKPNATAEDVKAMPKSVAEDIYRRQYAEKVGFDSLTAGIDFLAFDAAVLSGPSRANNWLKDNPTIEEYQAKRLAFYKSLKIWPTFGKGWTNRLDAGTKLAKSLPKEAPTSPSNTAVIISTTGSIAAGGIVATQVPQAWYEQLLQPQALMIGAAILVGSIVLCVYVVRRYKAYREINAISTITNVNKKTIGSKKKESIKI